MTLSLIKSCERALGVLRERLGDPWSCIVVYIQISDVLLNETSFFLFHVHEAPPQDLRWPV